MAGAAETEPAGTFTWKVTVAGTVTSPLGPRVAAAGAGAAAAAGGGDEAIGSAPGRRNRSQASTATLTSSSKPSPRAQTGRRRRGAATFTSNSAGADWRWRSVSDFFRASRMKDMSATVRARGARAQEGRVGIVERGVQCHLRLHAGDAVHRQPAAPLELLDHGHQ